jgi:hypothetical protein
VSTYPTLSASERWGKHLFACEVCCIDESEPEKDRLCAIGSVLRDASIKAYREASESRGDTAFGRGDSRGSGFTCELCKEPLLPHPVFFIEQHHDGIHMACDEQRLAEEELDAALRAGVR